MLRKELGTQKTGHLLDFSALDDVALKNFANPLAKERGPDEKSMKLQNRHGRIFQDIKTPGGKDWEHLCAVAFALMQEM